MNSAPQESQLKAAALKKVETKTGGGGPSAEEIASYAKIYTDNGGNLDKISASLGIKFKSGAKVKDAEDFAKQFLSGMILAE